MSKPNSIQIWVQAMRPKTLFASFCPILIAGALAYKANTLSILPLVLTLCCALLIQIGTNFANDYFDFKKGADTDARIGPTRATQAGWVTPLQMKKAFILIFLIAVILGLYLVYLGGWPIFLIGILSVICGVAYTGGPFPLGYLGLGDFFAWLFFGPIAVGGAYYLQAGIWTTESILAGAILGLFSIALIDVNNIRDYEQDLLAGKKTIVVRFGKRFAKGLYTLSILGGLVLPGVLSGSSHYSMWLPLILLPMANRMNIMMWTKAGSDLNSLLEKTGKLLFLASLLWATGIVI